MDPAFRELLADFLSEGAERTDKVEALLLRLAEADAASRAERVLAIKRELHTLKGNAGMMGLPAIQALAHELEDRVEGLDSAEPAALAAGIELSLDGIDRLRTLLGELAAVPAAPASPEPASPEPVGAQPAAHDAPLVPGLSTGDGRIRVPYGKIDELVDLQAETLVLRTRLLDAVTTGRRAAREGSAHADDWDLVSDAMQALEKSLERLQDRIIQLGMVPLEGLFGRLRRIVHDESLHEAKRIELAVRGGDTPIDKALLEVAGDALGHLVRNAVIHGIETPGTRRACGKPSTGTVRLEAAVVSNEVRLDVHDDGGGIDLERLQQQAPEPSSTRDDDPLSLVFEAGVTSRGDADLSAGRGVGLSAVKGSVERAGGRVDVRSEPGQGSTFTIHLPLTTTILRSLLLNADGETYALPLASVTEGMRLEPQSLHRVNEARVLRWRGRVLPLLDLGLAFDTASGSRNEGFAVIVELGSRTRAVVVDGIAGIRDIVVKSLDPIVGQPVGISGSTILGDGRVIMILDPASLVALPPSAGRPA